MSWYQLYDVLGLNEDLAREFVSRPPVACPYGGFPLEEGSDGTLHCPEGDFFWPEDLTRHA